MELSKLVVDVKEVWVEFPGFPKFEVLVASLSRKELVALRNRCVEKGYDKKTRAPTETLNDEKFLEEFTRATVKGWRGFKYSYLEQLMLVDVSKLNPDDCLDYNEDSARILVSESVNFDSWLNEVVFDLDNFRDRAKGPAVGSPGKVA
jgi:hypothetical protein